MQQSSPFQHDKTKALLRLRSASNNLNQVDKKRDGESLNEKASDSILMRLSFPSLGKGKRSV